MLHGWLSDGGAADACERRPRAGGGRNEGAPSAIRFCPESGAPAIALALELTLALLLLSLYSCSCSAPSQDPLGTIDQSKQLARRRANSTHA